MNNNQILREHLLDLLAGNSAHSSFDSVIEGIPEDVRGKMVPQINLSMWQVVEHLRICQKDILDYMLSSDYREMKFPDDYWPTQPFSKEAWHKSITAFREDLETIKGLVKDLSTDLYAKVPTGEHTLLREILLVADHNSYHVGQLMYLRHLLGIRSDELV